MPIGTTLNLAVADYKDANNWYWRLTDYEGRFLADQAVMLDPRDAEYEGFLDLPSFLAVHAAQDRRSQDEARLAKQLGEWIGRNFYGPIGEKILDAGTPAVVRVLVPESAAGLLYRPWELGYVRGQPLALQDVSLVFEVQGEGAKVKRLPVGERLRILAVFSLPVNTSALNVRQERYELAQTIRAIGQQGHAIDLRVLQYGATREALRHVLEEGEGWDVIHFSGHGLEAHLVLEKADGTEDLVPSDEIVKLLRPARGRLKWVTLSACLSAAATVEETLRWLGVEPKRAVAPTVATAELQTVARALVQSLDCAVLAMRYPVGDKFAIDLGRGLFQGILEQKQSLARALQVALPRAINRPDIEAAAVTTPTLFGRHAAELALPLPKGQALLRLGLAHFPPEPARFVGRVGLLTQAREAMARESVSNGVLFHGMPGGGKTGCALELAYQYQDIDRFQHFVWFEAPKEGHEISAALVGFAKQWDIQLDAPEVPLTAIVNTDASKFAANLPRISRFLEQRSVLLVLDNLESLLRKDGQWRDDRWENVIRALVDHRGQSRVVLTSRVRPQVLDARILPVALHPLTLEETALLARRSPNLGGLLRDPEHRQLVIRVLNLVQGHPELLKLAEAQAHTPERLAVHLKRAEAASTAGEAELEVFFRTGESALAADDFVSTLHTWTKSVCASLTAGARTLFYRLCCLEEEDRQQSVVKAAWGDVAAELRDVMASGLVDVDYRIHPAVAEAGREQAGPALADSVDNAMARLWINQWTTSVVGEDKGFGDFIRRASHSAVPYLMRQHRWEEAEAMLDSIVSRDGSQSALAEVLPQLSRIADLTDGTVEGLENANVLARALRLAGRTDEAAVIFQRLLERQATNKREYVIAAQAAGELVEIILLTTGDLRGALAVVERQKDFSRRAGLSKWSQLGNEVSRLRILNGLGRYGDVFDTVKALRHKVKRWKNLSLREVAEVSPLTVTSHLLHAGYVAAFGLNRLEEALWFIEELVRINVDRGATKLQVAQARFEGYAPLLRLKRYGEARSLLYQCLEVFQLEGDDKDLACIHSAIAALEDDVGHYAEAAHHLSTGLRFSYSRFLVEYCAIDHYRLAKSLIDVGADVRTATAHRLAGLLIWYQTNQPNLQRALPSMKRALSLISPPDVPATFDELRGLIEQIEGVRFRELFARLPQRARTGDEAINAVLAMVQEAEEGP